MKRMVERKPGHAEVVAVDSRAEEHRSRKLETG